MKGSVLEYVRFVRGRKERRKKVEVFLEDEFPQRYENILVVEASLSRLLPPGTLLSRKRPAGTVARLVWQQKSSGTCVALRYFACLPIDCLLDCYC